MEKVSGIGGLFFRAHDPKALRRWYQQHLGVSIAPSSYEESVWHSYQAAAAARVESEMGKFLRWLDGNEQEDPLLKAAIAHLWFVSIHPFEDGNGELEEQSLRCAWPDRTTALSVSTACRRRFLKNEKAITTFLRRPRLDRWT